MWDAETENANRKIHNTVFPRNLVRDGDMIPENNFYTSQIDIPLHGTPCLSVAQVSRALYQLTGAIKKGFNFVTTGIKIPPVIFPETLHNNWTNLQPLPCRVPSFTFRDSRQGYTCNVWPLIDLDMGALCPTLRIDPNVLSDHSAIPAMLRHATSLKSTCVNFQVCWRLGGYKDDPSIILTSVWLCLVKVIVKHEGYTRDR